MTPFLPSCIGVALFTLILAQSGFAALPQRGATVPWICHEAEEGILSGSAAVEGPSRSPGTFSGEASGRRCVILPETGAAVSFAATAAANAMVIRASIPDVPGGGGQEASISMYVNGQHRADIILSSVHSWIYGDDNIQTDDPANGPPRKIYEESRLLFPDFSLAVGDAIELRRDETDKASQYAVDFIDLEQVAAPKEMPEGWVSITDGSQGWAAAVADDETADDEAINQCINAVQAGRFAGVWIPPGTFVQNDKFTVSGAAIAGAGMWYSTLYCPEQALESGWGHTGFIINGNNCSFRDFRIEGWGGVRTQGGKAWVNGAHVGTRIEDMWVEGVQCGYWVGGTGESTDLQIRNSRFRNTGADAVNLCNGSTNCLVENCTARGTGDDAFAIWSATDLYPEPCRGNIIRNCTAALPWRAACFAIYGGGDNRIENCLGVDALSYPGLTVSSEFAPYPLESATVEGLSLIRCGASYWDVNQQFGALWLYSAGQSFSGVSIRDVDIVDPCFQGIHIQGNPGSAGNFPLSNTLLENIRIFNPTTWGIQIKDGAQGSVTLRNVELAENAFSVPRISNQSGSFTVYEEATMSQTAGGTALSPGITVQGSRLCIDVALANSREAVTISVYLPNGKRTLSLNRMCREGSSRIMLDKSSLGAAAGSCIVVVENGGEKKSYPLILGN